MQRSRRICVSRGPKPELASFGYSNRGGTTVSDTASQGERLLLIRQSENFSGPQRSFSRHGNASATPVFRKRGGYLVMSRNLYRTSLVVAVLGFFGPAPAADAASRRRP